MIVEPLPGSLATLWLSCALPEQLLKLCRPPNWWPISCAT
jgi:hypothetical protein